ncbi:MAG TPA: type II toxin-antitoxin system PemK/MazF family toxin [Gemmataceae bacterium]|nr:type II toxin-antitoxin system PemK/MazF family toxin [Gemmataceae bacterium]
MQRGEIYFVDLDPVVGREQAGVRPVVVVSIDTINQLPLVVTVVPGTNGANFRRDFPSTVRVPSNESGLPVETVFLCFQVRALDHSRFPGQPAGRLAPRRLQAIERAIRYCQGL